MIQGIGLNKVEQIVYRTTDYYLVTMAGFNDLYQVLQQACRDLYSESDTAQVVAAMQATELDQAGPCSGIPERLPYASTNQVSPQIRTQPQSQTFTAGTNVSLTVAIYGSYPLTYQWFRGGTLVSASTNVAANSVLTLTNVSAADAGNYFFIVTNAYGAATSQVATLRLPLPSPQIVLQGTNVLIQFESLTGYTYTLQSAPVLDGTNTVWTDGPALPGNGNWQAFEQPVTNSAMFFRTRRTMP